MDVSGAAADYDILERLGRGVLGTSYLVRRGVATRVIKLVNPSLLADFTARAQFLTEARQASELVHPHLARLHSFGFEADGNAHLETDFAPGPTVAEMVASGGALPLDLAQTIAAQVLDGVAHLHAHGLVHRAITADNIRVELGDDCVTARLVDLGIGRVDSPAIRLSGLVVGTLRYAAPESIISDEVGAVGQPADVYALGVVLYLMLTGAFPIAGKTAAAILDGHVGKPPRPFTETDPGEVVPAPVRGVVLRCLAKDPAERWGDAGAVASELRVAAGSGSDPGRTAAAISRWRQSAALGEAAAAAGAAGRAARRQEVATAAVVSDEVAPRAPLRLLGDDAVTATAAEVAAEIDRLLGERDEEAARLLLKEARYLLGAAPELAAAAERLDERRRLHRLFAEKVAGEATTYLATDLLREQEGEAPPPGRSWWKVAAWIALAAAVAVVALVLARG